MSIDVLIIDPITSPPDAAEVDSRGGATSPADLPTENPETHSKSETGAGQGSAANGLAARGDIQTRTLADITRDYVQLTKPRIVVMILVTTMATAVMGAQGLVALSDLVWLLLGTALVAGSAGAANQIWERVIDCSMARTANRPLPDGRLDLVPATLFTAAIGLVGSALLAQVFGMIPALAGIATWLLYVLVYTPMKTRTAWNTTVGAVAGALPVLIGYTATGGSLMAWTPWLLVGVLVAWQYPHFMSIAWMYRRQYDEAGFRMTTTVEPSGRSAGWQSIAGSIALIACGITLAWIPGGMIAPILATLGVIAACYPMLKASIRFAASPNDAMARKLLRSSLLVLPALLLIVTLRVFW
ncbi:MAG: protoheme IX farnesyltransferase [Pirellulaceae bacterium]|nr:protoheme IX farnesyltransferase [Pirellulaceae bacterium]